MSKKPLVVRDGNTVLKWNESRAVRDPTEIKKILDDIARCAVRDIIRAAVEKQMNNGAL